MNPAILMLLMNSTGRGFSSIDEPDDYGIYHHSSGGMDWFLWVVLIILLLVTIFGAYVIFNTFNP